MKPLRACLSSNSNQFIERCQHRLVIPKTVTAAQATSFLAQSHCSPNAIPHPIPLFYLKLEGCRSILGSRKKIISPWATKHYSLADYKPTGMSRSVNFWQPKTHISLTRRIASWSRKQCTSRLRLKHLQSAAKCLLMYLRWCQLKIAAWILRWPIKKTIRGGKSLCMINSLTENMILRYVNWPKKIVLRMLRTNTIASGSHQTLVEVAIKDK